MSAASTRPVFDELLEGLEDQPEIESLRQVFQRIEGMDAGNTEALIQGYQAAADRVEQVLWRGGCHEGLLALYQRLWRDMESRLAVSEADRRYRFVVVIPVADRPQHLQNCLASLLTLCDAFGYGGVANQTYRKIRVLVADDSRQAGNIRRHQELTEAFTRRGLEVHYFGQRQQLQQLERLPRGQRQALRWVLGENPPQAYFHKGASITRNLTYLKLAEWARADRRQLFWFMDSDQEFCVNTPERDARLYALNYFQRLDQIFSHTDIQVLTGKVVGDPPVSPAVMAGNFLADVLTFLSEMAGLDPREPCTFHRQARQQSDDAAYHDMAELFGFKPAAASRYACRIGEDHDHVRCLADFCARLSRFFDGEHPTRKTYYAHQPPLDGIKPARTVYTGNYVLSAEALQFFIPFATLKLRMAGPVLGRILQSRLGRRFASANLPLLHRRTLDGLGRSEFRAGIERNAQRVDLSGEFERQFYGDVMLFTIERLCCHGYPFEAVAEKTQEAALSEIEASLRHKYAAKQAQIRARLSELRVLLDEPRHWWHQDPAYAPMQRQLLHFLHNMESNFGADAPAYRIIQALDERPQRHQQLLTAIRQLPQDRAVWLHALGLES
jgi:hypothetical protein